MIELAGHSGGASPAGAPKDGPIAAGGWGALETSAPGSASSPPCDSTLTATRHSEDTPTSQLEESDSSSPPPQDSLRFRPDIFEEISEKRAWVFNRSASKRDLSQNSIRGPTPAIVTSRSRPA